MDHYRPNRVQIRVGDTELSDKTVDRLVPMPAAGMPHRIVMISGKQGAGKSTLASGLAGLASAAGYGVYRTRFAAVLYEIHDAARLVATKYGIPWPQKYGRFLQVLGTELGRDHFGDDVWVDACRADVERHLVDARRPTIVLIDDMRFPNEFTAFASTPHPILRIRLVAAEGSRIVRADGWRLDTQHPSETGLDALEAAGAFDLTICTDGVGTAPATLRRAAEALGLHTPEEIPNATFPDTTPAAG